MANRLSHSQMNKAIFCGEAWRLHYEEKYRPIEIGSALLFGSAIGKTFECMLNEDESKVFEVSLSGKQIANDYDVFDYYWRNQEINGVLTNIQEYPHVAYSKYDTDLDLLTRAEFAEANGDPSKLAWFSLRHKAHLIIDSFKANLLPKIKKVYSVEEKIELENDEGDSSIGYADAVVDIEGYDKPVILDFKTAAWEYEPESVRTSVQLSQYMHVLGEKYNTRLAGYAVFLKNIEKNRVKICTVCGFDGSAGKFKTCNNEIKGKRCNGEWKETSKPECKMQLIVDEIPQSTEDFIISNIENVNAMIKARIFVKNINGCTNNGFNRKCEFYNLCWGNDTSQYVKLENKDEN